MKPALNVDHSTPAGPLAGITVLDLSAYIAGPYGCSLLADQGATVIKIEPPLGDNLRRYPSTLANESRAFLGVNRSKVGIALDLKTAEGLEVLYRLVRSADVLVHNFRPAVPARLGIGYADLSRINPRLVYCAVSGYGDTGPLQNKAGYDQVLQTMTGMCSAQAKPGCPPEILYGSVVDYYAAAMVAGAVSSALYERERSGKGQEVGVSLLRSALAMQSARLVWAEGEAQEIDRDMRSGGITGIHPTREGHLYISANTPHFWQALCEKTGLQHLFHDARFDTVRKRAEQVEVIVPQLHEALAQHSALEWEVIFGEQVPCAAARRVDEMFDHPQCQSEALVADFEHPELGRYRGFTRATTFSRTPGRVPYAAPQFGADSDRVLAAAGFNCEQVAGLRLRGAVL
ncbi:CoA transferase [Pseudomonas sp. S31]|uniref:CaiB/BaiF CoA transferase family protein n=1 Tax=Pseudomonas sp. S31 TaxID=1564473 RepID=UPI0019147503|nr:CoA transferase [Pseudomonas sp. S31]MBK5000237.1 CoA transferase [Pseudomonas sp. S31]